MSSGGMIRKIMTHSAMAWKEITIAEADSRCVLLPPSSLENDAAQNPNAVLVSARYASRLSVGYCQDTSARAKLQTTPAPLDPTVNALTDTNCFAHSRAAWSRSWDYPGLTPWAVLLRRFAAGV